MHMLYIQRKYVLDFHSYFMATSRRRKFMKFEI